MALVNQISRVINDPTRVLYKLWAELSPQGLLQSYAALSQKFGIHELYFILSFDCDTEPDIAVVEDVHVRLQGMGVTPVYAVPGDMLRRGQTTYRRIQETGAQFINHGDIEHTRYNAQNGVYESCFFYDEEPFERLRKDIVDGHNTIREILGVTAKGFRTPHFGTFQKPAQLKFLYRVLKELDYTFSTSTTPIHGLRQGASFDVGEGIKEFPVSGMVGNPFQILDSWGFFAAPDRTKSPKNYVDEVARLSMSLSKCGAGIVNIYADPSHIHDQEIFFAAIAECQKFARSASYDELLGVMSV